MELPGSVKQTCYCIKKYSFTFAVYLVGLISILAAIYSQYFVPQNGFFARVLMIYGIPILVASTLLGKSLYERSIKNNSKALDYGLAFWGLFSVISFAAGLVVYRLIENYNPEAINLLDRPNPAAPSSSTLAWLMIPVSLLIIGPAEELIFRGFVFGGLLKIFKNKYWLLWAFVSSVIFAMVHAYYLFTFGVVSTIIFIDIVAMGMALSVAYYASDGNLLIPALLHGVYDAFGFLTMATDSNIGVLLRIAMAGIGVLVAFSLLFKNYLQPTVPRTA